MDYSEMLFAVAVRDRSFQFMLQEAKKEDVNVNVFMANHDNVPFMIKAIEEYQGVAGVIRNYVASKG